MKPEQFETIVDSISNKLDDIARKVVETGNLKEALRNSIKGTTWRDMRIELDNDYAEFQNNGTDKIPARQFIGMTNTLEDKLKKIIEEEITNMFNQ